MAASRSRDLVGCSLPWPELGEAAPAALQTQLSAWLGPGGAGVVRAMDADFHACWFATHQVGLPQDVAAAVPKRQREYFYGRVCARAAVRRLREGFDGAIPAGADRRPVFPAGLEGSISHSDELAVAVCRSAERGRLGVDVERIMAKAVASELEHAIAHPAELELAGWGALPHRLRLTLIFSAKEALFKAIWPDVRRHAELLASAVVDVAPGWLCLEVRQDFPGGWTAGRRVAARWGRCGPEVLTLVSLEQKDVNS